MNYLSCSEAANILGSTTRRIQQMCKRGDIHGAIALLNSGVSIVIKVGIAFQGKMPRCERRL